MAKIIKMKDVLNEENLLDISFPPHIEIPEDYWVCSHDVEYIIIED